MRILCILLLLSYFSFSQSLNYNYSVTFGNHVIAINDINYNFIEGDIIGCFFINSFGDFQCCGSTVYINEETLFVSAWPDDILTDYEEGFSDGDELIFAFYLCDDNEYFSSEYTLNSEDSMQHTEVLYTTNGISVVEVDILFPPNCDSSVLEAEIIQKKAIKMIDFLGRNYQKNNYNSSFFIIYDDGTVEKKLIIR